VASGGSSVGVSGIPTERVVEIQEALIKQGYLAAPASGTYDQDTIAAMKAFQESNKLSRTGMPSAHSLKKLGVAKQSKDGYAVPVNRVSDAQVKNQ
jgi:peptidoglycan hydrolase-like protein with peptidoglycan-binding domain